MESQTITIPKKIFSKIIEDVEILIDDVEIALDQKVQKRIEEVDSDKIIGKSEQDLDEYLKKRGIEIA